MVFYSRPLPSGAKLFQAVMNAVPASRTYRYALIFSHPKLEVNSSILRCALCGLQIRPDAIRCVYCQPVKKNFRALVRGNSHIKTVTPPAVTEGVERGHINV
jgi:hypothetical protein